MGHQIISGRNLAEGDSDAIVVNNSLATKYPQLKVGNTVSFQMGPAYTTWKVVGIAREAYSPPIAYIPLNFMSERHPGVVNNLRLALDKNDPDSIDVVKAELDKNLEREGLRARSSVSKAESRLGFDQHLLMIYLFVIVM